MPTIGPIIEHRAEYFPSKPTFRSLHEDRTRYRWSGPAPFPIQPYTYFKATSDDPSGDAPNTFAGAFAIPSNAHRISLENKAYQRLWDKIRSGIELGETLATYPQAIEMISNRAVQLTRAFSALRRGRPREFWKIVSSSPRGRHRGVTRTRRGLNAAANTWLEYNYGWSPLISDIGGAVEILQREFTDRQHFVARSAFVSSGTSGRDLNYQWFTTFQSKLMCETSVIARVANPNKFLANQLGFANPAKLAWDLVPFSFVVDWFLPIGDLLQSLSDDFGLEVSNGYVTIYTNLSAKSTYKQSTTVDSHNSTGTYVNRQVRLPSYNWNGFHHSPITGWRRAASAVSLLIANFLR